MSYLKGGMYAWRDTDNMYLWATCPKEQTDDVAAFDPIKWGDAECDCSDESICGGEGVSGGIRISLHLFDALVLYRFSQLVFDPRSEAEYEDALETAERRVGNFGSDAFAVHVLDRDVALERLAKRVKGMFGGR